MLPYDFFKEQNELKNAAYFTIKKRERSRIGNPAMSKRLTEAERFVRRGVYDLKIPKKTIVNSLIEKYGLTTREARQIHKNVVNRKMRERRTTAGSKRHHAELVKIS